MPNVKANLTPLTEKEEHLSQICTNIKEEADNGDVSSDLYQRPCNIISLCYFNFSFTFLMVKHPKISELLKVDSNAK